jgi:D-alanyl-D-alanine carboxypeptidase/Putative peptidoglycan binding domain
MPTQGISASVGRGGANRQEDVLIVQNVLLARGYSAVGSANGVCGDSTVDAIISFQSGFLRKPDGVVDPDGNTWRHLAATFSGDADTPPAGTNSLTRPVPRPAPESINIGLSTVSNEYMLQKLGAPLTGGGYNSLCQTPTNVRLRRNLPTDTVGPFRVTGLLPAVLSLKAVMADISSEQPAVYRALGTAGMLCCRLQRGSTTAISNHSWGTAIDLTLNGVLDAYGDDKVQFGLTLIAPIFNRHGWYWGAAFRKEDGMHFEGSKALIDQWAEQLT